MKSTDKRQGFTIIEVVLVLAIAGLIFLMIFIALPALQRGQRDQGRRTDVGTVASAMNTYKANNNNNISALNQTAARNYVEALSTYDKTFGTNLNVYPYAAAAAAVTADQIFIYTNSQCGTADGDNTHPLVSAPRSIAVVGGLENNGSTVIAYCQDA